MGFTKQNRPMPIKWIQKNEDKLRFDLTIQRSEVWDLDRKSLFIHSLIADYPVPPFYALDNNDDEYLWVLDGKQRLTTIIKFLKGEFALSENTPPIDDVEIDSMKFEELPEDFQDEIRTRNLLVYTFKNMTEDERDEMFLRLNNGMALTKMELNRVTASSKVMSIIQEIAKESFFADNISITTNQRNRFVDEELLLQIFMLLIKGETGLASKDITEFVFELKDSGIPEDKIEIVKNTTQYLNEALPVKEKFLKKINIPMIFMMAIKATEEKVEPVKFGGWVQQFFDNISYKYKDACSSGSAKKENVKVRLEEIEKNYEQNIATAFDYKKPEQKQTRKRGRPLKVKNKVETTQSNSKEIDNSQQEMTP